MRNGVSRLTEREREVLRLFARGHDAKSSAQALGISVNSVNERLREARQKLGVSSSREAARMLAAHGGGGDNFLGSEKIGLGSTGDAGANAGSPSLGRGWLIAGGTIMILLLGTVAALLAEEREQARAPIVTLPAPNVVAASPRPGSVIRPGPFQLSVTFDMPMHAQSYSFVQSSAETYPQCSNRPALSRDRRTYSMRCMALTDRQYEVWFNRPPYMNFKSEAGVPAAPFQLRFRSSGR